MTTAASDRNDSIFDSGLSLPLLTLSDSAIRHNVQAMSDFCTTNGIAIAPHCKTHMSVELWRLQEEAGAVCATVATVAQAAAFAEEGVRRILIANEVVDAGGLATIARMRRAHPELELSILVDSVVGIEAAAAHNDSALEALPVLIEFGASGRRAGCRTLEQAVSLAEAIDASPALVLAGVEGYEGVFGSEPEERRAAVVDAFLDSAGDVVAALIERRLVRTPTIASFGGSRFYPNVVERIRSRFTADEATVIIRSGCYLTHDDGTYARSHESVVSSVGKPDLRAAMRVWGSIVSVPEPGEAIAGIGKRDVSFDEGMPVALLRRRDGVTSPLGGVRVEKLNDQHAFLAFDDPDALAVGDAVAFGISHPCTTFDAWRAALIVDDDDRIIGRALTLFH
jgi:D-serine dehydratase